MVTALRLMPDEKPESEPVDVAFVALRGRYQAVVHERDTLLAKLDRYERMEKVTLICDGTPCKSAYVFVGPAPAETKVLGLAIGDGWTIIGTKHYCPGCRR